MAKDANELNWTEIMNKFAVYKGPMIDFCRENSDSSKRMQTFEKKIVVNGRKDLVRVVVDSKDGNRVITVFPVRGGNW
jgi:hypothetical protein